jgi:hypothetical protein
MQLAEVRKLADLIGIVELPWGQIMSRLTPATTTNAGAQTIFIAVLPKRPNCVFLQLAEVLNLAELIEIVQLP